MSVSLRASEDHGKMMERTKLNDQPRHRAEYVVLISGMLTTITRMARAAMAWRRAGQIRVDMSCSSEDARGPNLALGCT